MSIKRIIKDNNQAEFSEFLSKNKLSDEDYYLLLRDASKEMIQIFIESDFNLLDVDEYGLNLLENCLEFNRNDIIPLVAFKLLNDYEDDFSILDLENFIVKCIARNNYLSPVKLLQYKPEIEKNQLNYLLFLAVVNEDHLAIIDLNLYGAELDCIIDGVSLYSIILENNLKKINRLFKKLKGNLVLKQTELASFNEEDYYQLSKFIDKQNLIYFRYYIGKFGKDILLKDFNGESLYLKIKNDKNNKLNNINLMKK